MLLTDIDATEECNLRVRENALGSSLITSISPHGSTIELSYEPHIASRQFGESLMSNVMRGICDYELSRDPDETSQPSSESLRNDPLLGNKELLWLGQQLSRRS